MIHGLTRSSPVARAKCAVDSVRYARTLPAFGAAGSRRHKLRAVRPMAAWPCGRSPAPRPPGRRAGVGSTGAAQGNTRVLRPAVARAGPPPGRTQAPRLAGPRVSTAAQGEPPRVTHRGPVRDGDRAVQAQRAGSARRSTGAGPARPSARTGWPSTEACCDSESRRSRPSWPERPSPRLIRGCSEKRAWRSCESSRDHESCVSWRIWVLKPSCAVPGQEPPAWPMSPVARRALPLLGRPLSTEHDDGRRHAVQTSGSTGWAIRAWAKDTVTTLKARVATRRRASSRVSRSAYRAARPGSGRRARSEAGG